MRPRCAKPCRPGCARRGWCCSGRRRCACRRSCQCGMSPSSESSVLPPSVAQDTRAAVTPLRLRPVGACHQGGGAVGRCLERRVLGSRRSRSVAVVLRSSRCLTVPARKAVGRAIRVSSYFTLVFTLLRGLGVGTTSCLRVVPHETVESGSLETATKRSKLTITREPGDRAAAVRLECRNGRPASGTHATLGRATVKSARSGGCALKQESEPCLGCSDVAVVRARGC